MRRVPMLDTYMPLGSAFSGYDPAKEALANKHIEVYKRKKDRSKSPVLLQRDRSTQIRERIGQWEAEKGTYTTDLQYAKARAQYLEDLIRLQRETVERPLRRHNQDLEGRMETMQNQLNMVVSKMDMQSKEIQAKDSLVEELRSDKQRQAEAAKEEMGRITTIHEKHLAAEKRVFEAEVERLSSELRTVGSELQTTQRRAPHSPSNARLQWLNDEHAKREAEIGKLTEALEKKDSSLRAAHDKLHALETEMVIAGGTLEHGSFVKMWESLAGLVTDTDRHRAGLRTAVAQLELCSVGRQPGKAKPIPPMPQAGDTLRKWADALCLLSTAASDESGDGRSYSVAVLRRVIEAHQTSLEVAAEKERIAGSEKALERQRIAEIERDRDEERRLYFKERERLRSEAGSLKKNMTDMQAKSTKLMNATIDSNAQTEASLGALAESYTQTIATSADPMLSRMKTDIDIKASTIQDLSRSVESRDATIRTLREQRERFISFVFDATADREDGHLSSPKNVEMHTSPRRPSELAQLSTMEFLGR